MVKERCQHRTVLLQEETTGLIEWLLKDGKPVHDYVPQGDVTGRFRVACEACGMNRWYRSRRAAPKWVQALYDAATTPAGADGQGGGAMEGLYRVRWYSRLTGYESGGEEPVSKQVADAWVQELNATYPDLHHWAELVTCGECGKPAGTCLCGVRECV